MTHIVNTILPVQKSTATFVENCRKYHHFFIIFILLFLRPQSANGVMAIDMFNMGSPIYDNQVTQKTYPQSNQNRLKNSLETVYPMGNLRMNYACGQWNLLGKNRAISRSVKKGIPWYDNVNDTFYLDSAKLVRVDSSKIASAWEYTVENGNGCRVFFNNPDSVSASYWKIVNPDGSEETYESRMSGRTINGMIVPRGWLLTELKNSDYYERYHYQEIGGEYILKRVVSGENDSIADHMTFVDWSYAGQNSTVDYRYGVKVERGRIPRIIYTLHRKTGISYSWLTDNSQNPYAYLFDGATFAINEVFILDWTFGKAGEWQLAKITPFGSDISLSIKRWWDESNIVREVLVTGGIAKEATCFEYFPYKPQFSSQWIEYHFTNKNYPACLFGRNETIVDVNGDGLLDFVKKTEGNLLLHIWYNRHNQIDDNTMQFEYQVDTIPDKRALNHAGGMFDWDGDGIAERLLEVHNSSSKWSLYIYKGIQQANQIDFNVPSETVLNNWNTFYSTSVGNLQEIMNVPLDIDGDGGRDKIRVNFTNNTLFASHSKTNLTDDVMYAGFGGGFIEMYTSENGRTNDVVADLIDFNGDGLPDRVVKDKDILAVRFNQGYSFTDPHFFYTDPDIESLSERNSDTRFIGYDFLDMNGDGLLDRVRKKDGESLQIWFNTGTGFSADAMKMNSPSTDTKSLMCTSPLNDLARKIYNAYLDLNGDGLPDRIENSGDGIFRVAYSLLSDANQPAGTLASVTGFTGTVAPKSVRKKGTCQFAVEAVYKQNNCINVVAYLTKSQYVTLELFDLSGRKHGFQYKRFLGSGKNVEQLPIDNSQNNAATVTFLRVTTGNSSRTIRIGVAGAR